MQRQSASPSTASAQIAHLSRPDHRSPLLQPCRLHSNASPSDLTSVCANETTRLISQTCIPVSACQSGPQHQKFHHLRNTLFVCPDVDISSVKYRALANNYILNLLSHHAIQHATKIPLTSLVGNPVAARFARSPPFSPQILHSVGRTITTHKEGEKVAFFKFDITLLIRASSTS